VIRHRKAITDTLPAIRVRLRTFGYRGGMMWNLDRFAGPRLADVLQAKIINGTCPPGSRIPPYRKLRIAHGIALNAAQAAIRIPAAEGLMEIRPASGAYVRDSACDDDGQTLRAELASIRAALRRSKEDPDAAESRVAVLLSRLRSEEGVR
jgi:DNA-binding FadR family transcriptional regulator